MRQVEALDRNKSSSGKIPTSVLKATKEAVCPFLTDFINSAIYNCRFPDQLKEANVSPKFKSKDATAKLNFRSISILPSVSKIYEGVLKNQITPFFQDKLSSVMLSGFRERYSTQHALIRVLELWRRCLDSSGIVGTILMDLSQAYDCLPHDLLIAKLEAYGFSNDSLQLVCSYLESRYQRVKIGSCKSSRQKIKIGVPQGSVQGPLLFNIFINDLFAMSLESEICNFADDNTIFACGNNIQEIVIKLENDLGLLLDWFAKNGMIENSEKFQIMFLGLKDERCLRLNIEGKKLPTTDTVKLLGIQIDNKLKLNKHIHGLCSKVHHKVSAFARLNTYLSPDQATKICHTIILSNFNYCPLLWLFSSDAANDEINRAPKRCLRILYQDYESSFQLLLSRDNSQTIHVKNLQKLMTEIYKSTKKLNLSYLWEFHERKETTYDLRTKDLCKLPKIKKRYGAESLSFRGSLLWNTISDKIKQSPSLAAFKVPLT